MEELFGVPMNMIAGTAGGLTIAILLLLALVAIRNPVMFKQGLRNIPRRKAQTTLIVFGLMLATVIMTAAFGTGDTVASTATDDYFDLLGEVDELVEWNTDDFPAAEDERKIPAAELERLRAEFAGDTDVEAFLGAIVETFSVVNQRNNLNEANANIVGVDPSQLEPFGGIPGGASSLDGNKVLLNEDLAEALDARVGDTITLLFEFQGYEAVVAEIAPNSVLTGRFDIGSEDLPGAMVNLDFLRSINGGGDTYDIIAVTNIGDARGGLSHSDAAEMKLSAALTGTPFEASAFKKDVIDFATLISSFFTTFFVVFGLFSIFAGVLLIFLIFIMLAAERKPEMGMARAVGAKRRHLTESFLAEGMGYDLCAALVGLFTGMVVTLLMVTFVNSTGETGLGIDLRVTFTPRGLLTSFCVGVITTFLIIFLASVRAAHLNIVSAIRDIPESRPLNPEFSTFFGFLRAAVNVFASFGFAMAFGMLGARISPVFFLGAFVGLVGPFIYVLKGNNFYLPKDERLVGGRIPTWPFFFVITIPFYFLAWLLVRVTRDRRPRSVPLWSMVVALLLPPEGVVFASLQDRDRPIAWGAGLGVLGGVLGAICIEWGLSADNTFLFSAGTSLILLAVGTTLRYFHIHERASMSCISLLALLYWFLSPAGAFDWLIGEMDVGFEMFFLSGVAMVGAGTFIITYNADIALPVAATLGAKFGRVVPAVKTAIAYPLTARVRTGLTIAMIGLIMFSLIVFSTVNSNFARIFLGDDAKGGFDNMVITNSNNKADSLEKELDLAGVDTGPLAAIAETRWAGFDEVQIADPDWGGEDSDGQYKRYVILGGDSTFLTENSIGLKYIAVGYDSEEATWEAVAADANLAIIDGELVDNDGGPGFRDEDILVLDVVLSDGFEPFELTFFDPASGAETTVTVVGQMEDSASVFFSSIVVNRSTLMTAFPGAEAQVWYLKLESGADSREYARTVESALVQASAESLDKLLDDRRTAQAGFLLLFQGFMGLGLIIGIAALGVVAFRAVVERRQQIGMLRAIGYQRSMVALSFLFESGFIALSGILLGLVMGVSFAWVLFTSGTVGEEARGFEFTVPWVQIFLICGLALAASLVMTYFPARSAAGVEVAEALRYE